MPVSLQIYKIVFFSHLISLMFSVVSRNVFTVYVELQDNLLKFCAVPFYVQKYMHMYVGVPVWKRDFKYVIVLFYAHIVFIHFVFHFSINLV
jgi:hypothetical protein